MLFDRRFWNGIADGSITLAFRIWKRPTVKTGGNLRSPAGYLAIDFVEPISVDSITTADAKRAGFASRAELFEMLDAGREGTLYRIAFRLAGPDPRTALQASAQLPDDAFHALQRRLDNLDRRSPTGPWTLRILQLIAERPETRSAFLARELNVEKGWLKPNVRKLKNLGLTESLEIGYRISVRGAAYLKRVRRRR
jgi:hypothetical protein